MRRSFFNIKIQITALKDPQGSKDKIYDRIIKFYENCKKVNIITI